MNVHGKALLVAVMLFVSQSNFCQTLFTYGSHAVSKHEFELAFDKNNIGGQRDENAYRNYLELYIRYKLKVQAAYDIKLDTLAIQKEELQNFRNQVAESYLTDEEVMQALVNEAFLRSQKDIHLEHIFIKFNSPDDTLDAYKKVLQAYKQLQEGKSFASVATAFSEDPSVNSNKGDIGYITVFTLPYTLENLAYSLKPGSFSKPLKGKSGYHIFRNVEERKAVGFMTVAQILLSLPYGAGATQKSQQERHADSIYAAAATGASFEELASKYSNDNLSFRSGGVLPEFGVGRYAPAFEKAAFALTTDGQVSKPVETEYGYHIIKRISSNPVPGAKTPEYMAALSQKVNNDLRAQTASASMTKKILQRIQYKKPTINEKRLWAYADSVLKEKTLPTFPDLKNSTVLFSFAKRKYTLKEWANYLEAIRNVPALVTGKSKAELLQQFVDASAVEYYREHLEDYNKAFAAQLEDFKNGNLLFECMQRYVWAKAGNDTAGLKKFYEKNENKYWWQPGVNAVLFSSDDQKSITELYKKTEAEKENWRTLIIPYENSVQADSGRYEYDQLPMDGVNNLDEGFVTAPVKSDRDNMYFFIYIVKKYNEKTHRNFEEARGFVLNDYQNYLEEEWINNLKKKYPVTVNSTVLESLWK